MLINDRYAIPHAMFRLDMAGRDLSEYLMTKDDMCSVVRVLILTQVWAGRQASLYGTSRSGTAQPATL